ncbi:MAG: glycosyltransferase family 2 protein [Candidatus Brocadiaceae bacterium]|jgi:glycosyltransferase involved in cell wall biosynthesis
MIGGQAVSAFVITYNEQKALRDCLESIKWADELVVVDSYSDDATVEIAREYTDRIILREFRSFLDQTRFAFEQTGCDWVVWLDADERLTRQACEEIERELSRPDGPDFDGFAFPRRTWFLDRWVTHSGWYPQHKLRLFRRDVADIVGYPPHPQAVVPGPVKKLKGDILHHSYPGGVLDMVRRSARFAELAAQSRYKEGRRFSALSLLLKPPLELLKKYVVRLGFLDGLPGFAIAVGSAYYRFVREVRLWELAHRAEPEAFGEASEGQGDDF